MTDDSLWSNTTSSEGIDKSNLNCGAKGLGYFCAMNLTDIGGLLKLIYEMLKRYLLRLEGLLIAYFQFSSLGQVSSVE